MHCTSICDGDQSEIKGSSTHTSSNQGIKMAFRPQIWSKSKWNPRLCTLSLTVNCRASYGRSFTVLCPLACLDTDNRSGYGFMGIWRYQHVCACAYVHVGVSCTLIPQLQAHPAMLASYPGSECMMEKLKVILHVGDTAVVKPWRFRVDSSKIVEYSRGSYAN